MVKHVFCNISSAEVKQNVEHTSLRLQRIPQSSTGIPLE